MIITMLSLFQMLKKTTGFENKNADAGVGNEPNGAIDVQVERIVNENLVDPDSPGVTKAIPGASTDGTV
jgi:hypothetical protein